MNWMQNRPLRILALALLAASGTSLFAPPGASAKEWGIEVELRSGFRQDDIRIEGADPFSGTAVLDLRDTKIHHLELSGRALIQEGFYYRGSIGVGWYYDGTLVASEDGEDGAPGLYPLGIRPYQLTGTVDGEMLFDVSGGVGYQFSLFDDRLKLAPLGGYSFHKNNVSTDGTTFAQIDGDTLVNGPSTGFDTVWIGPWIGFDAVGSITPTWSVLVEFEYHWVDLEGLQRLIVPEFAEPRNGTGNGISWGVGTRYHFGKRISGELIYRAHSWDARTNRSFKVKWESSILAAGLILRF